MQYLVPDWPQPNKLKSFVTLAGDTSHSKYGTGNLGLYTGDDLLSIKKNRQLLVQTMSWNTPPLWLKQVHGAAVVKIEANKNNINQAPDEQEADAVYTKLAGVPCVVLTADCLPILVASDSSSEIAAIHGGWRGLAAGVIASVLACFEAPMAELKLWFGPAIGPKHFEVGEEVRQCFIDQYSALASAFRINTQSASYLKNPRGESQKWWMDIFKAARLIAQQLGVTQIYGGDHCTFSDPRFFSYRKDKVTGRFATGLWIEPLT